MHYWRHQFLWSDHVDKSTRVAIGISESLDNNLTNERQGDTILASDWPAVTWIDLDLLRYQELTSSHVERKLAYLGQEWARPINNMTDDKMTIRAVVWPDHIEATERWVIKCDILKSDLQRIFVKSTTLFFFRRDKYNEFKSLHSSKYIIIE